MNVRYEDIDHAMEKGAGNFEEVQKITRCSTSCGTCESRIREYINNRKINRK